MKLFYSPNACSIAIHIILEEIGVKYELARLDFSQKEQYQPAFMALNPKSKVPVLLLDDGQVITELPAIAWYLARSYGQAKLLPAGIVQETQALELLDYMVATMHMRGYTRIFRASLFTPSTADEAKVAEAGAEIVRKGFAILAPALADKEYLLGDYSIADAVLFYLEYWAVGRAGITLEPQFAAHLQRMLARPAVIRVLAAEGLA